MKNFFRNIFDWFIDWLPFAGAVVMLVGVTLFSVVSIAGAVLFVAAIIFAPILIFSFTAIHIAEMFAK